MKIVKRILYVVLILAIIFFCARCTIKFIDHVTYSETFTYDLYELSPGIYGYYTTVTSSIPSHNYEMITLCLNGDILTLKGDVNIHYTDGKNTLVWTDVNIVRGDTFDIYVPHGSIELRPALTQS